MESKNPIELAITLAGGSEAKLAKAIGFSQPLINKAKKAGRAGPRLAIAIDRYSNGTIPASVSCPDLLREPKDAAEGSEPERQVS